MKRYHAAEKPDFLSPSFDWLRMRSSFINALHLMVSLSNHGQRPFSASCYKSISAESTFEGMPMNISRLLTAVAASLAMLATATLGTAAEAKTGKTYHRTAMKRQGSCPLHRTSEGELVDCNGWRLRPGGWDNTCFNLDYLPSQFACSSRGRR